MIALQNGQVFRSHSALDFDESIELYLSSLLSTCNKFLSFLLQSLGDSILSCLYDSDRLVFYFYRIDSTLHKRLVSLFYFSIDSRCILIRSLSWCIRLNIRALKWALIVLSSFLSLMGAIRLLLTFRSLKSIYVILFLHLALMNFYCSPEVGETIPSSYPFLGDLI